MNKISLLALLVLTTAGCENKPLIECQENKTILETEISALEEKLVVSLEVNETTIAQSQELAKKLNLKLKNQQEKLDKLQDSMVLATTDLREKLQKAIQEFKGADAKRKQLVQKLSDSEQELVNAKTDSDQLNQKNVELQNKINVAQSQSTELTAQIEALQKQNADLVAKIKELENAIAELKAKQAAAGAEGKPAQ